MYLSLYILKERKRRKNHRKNAVLILRYNEAILIVCDVLRWIRELFMTGAKRDLEESDIYRPIRADESEKLTDHLEK